MYLKIIVSSCTLAQLMLNFNQFRTFGYIAQIRRSYGLFLVILPMIAQQKTGAEGRPPAPELFQYELRP
jgi:hypothetical protein